MSGGFGRKTSKHMVPILIPRPDISNPSSNNKPPGGPKELPERTYLKATIRIRKMEPLARVRRKGWILPWKWPTLWLEISEYISKAPWFNSHGTRSIRQNQAIQTCLHELMHIALWDDTSILHSKDVNSLLYYFVDGETLEPTAWDLDQMQEASKRIGKIEIVLEDKLMYSLTYLHIHEAIYLWNKWIGRDFFKLTEK